MFRTQRIAVDTVHHCFQPETLAVVIHHDLRSELERRRRPLIFRDVANSLPKHVQENLVLLQNQFSIRLALDDQRTVQVFQKIKVGRATDLVRPGVTQLKEREQKRLPVDATRALRVHVPVDFCDGPQLRVV